MRFGDQGWRTIVRGGSEVHHEGLDAKPEPEMYVPYGQIPNVEARPTIVVRTLVEPASVTSALRNVSFIVSIWSIGTITHYAI